MEREEDACRRLTQGSVGNCTSRKDSNYVDGKAKKREKKGRQAKTSGIKGKKRAVYSGHGLC